MPKLTEEEKARRALDRRRKEALQAEEDAVRREHKRREWETNGTYLTREEYAAGAPCRGCGLPIIDGLGSWPALLKMDDKQRGEYEAAQAEFRQRHASCRDGQWSVEGSQAKHCCFCCPPPPLSRAQLDKIAAILTPTTPRDPAQLDTWRLTLTCDHVVDKEQHRSHSYWSTRVVTCPECQQPRGVVTTEKLPPTAMRRKTEERQVDSELAKVRAEHERLQKKADAARKRLRVLESKRASLDVTDGGAQGGTTTPS